jgi:hypothetical protein
MQMRAHGANRQFERLRNLLITALLLMIEHQYGPLDRAELLQLLFYRIPELLLGKLLLRVWAGVWQAIFPVRVLIRKGNQRPVVAATALPFVLGHVGDDAIQVGAEQGFAAKGTQRPVEAQKDLLGKIVDMFAAAGQANKGAEDHGLMVSDNLLEAGVAGLQEGSDCESRRKFHGQTETLSETDSLRRSERKVKLMDFRLGPFMIPLGAFLVAIVAIVAGVMAEANRVRIRAEQRMAMVARGMSADDIDKLLGKRSDEAKPVRDPLRSLANTRRTAIVLISSGVGLSLFFLMLTWIVGEHNVLAGAAVGLMPLAVGVGFLIDYHLQKRDLSRFGLEIGQAE